MKIYLDLLPEDRKKEISRKKRFRIVAKQGFLFTTPIFLFIAILASINLILKTQNDGMEQALLIGGGQDKYHNLKFYEDEFRSINEKVRNINMFQEKHLKWSNALAHLLEVIPDGVTVTDLSSNNHQIFLVGKAREREILISFRDSMGQSECFEGVNVPLSNLVTKADIDFQMDFLIKNDCLVK